MADSVENPVEINTGVSVSIGEIIFDWLEEIGILLPLTEGVVAFRSVIVVSPIPVPVPLLVIGVFVLLLPVTVEESTAAVPVRDEKVGSAPDTEELKTEADQTEDSGSVGSRVLDVTTKVALRDDGDDTDRVWESEPKEVIDPKDCTDEAFVRIGKPDTPVEKVTDTTVVEGAEAVEGLEAVEDPETVESPEVVEDAKVVVGEAVMGVLLPVDEVPNGNEDKTPEPE